jgi:large subunit ribosomal protein L4
MQVDIHDTAGSVVGQTELDETVWGIEPNIAVMHQALVRQQANARLGTHNTKTRGEVRGGGAKPWRQKGTGRARAGSRRATQWRGGQTVFGPVVRDHSFQLNKKVRKLALKSALSSKQADGKLIVIEDAKSAEARTGALAAQLAALGWDSALIIDGPEVDSNFARAAANIPRIDVLPQQGANVYDILRRDTLVLTKDAVKALVERLK